MHGHKRTSSLVFSQNLVIKVSVTKIESKHVFLSMLQLFSAIQQLDVIMKIKRAKQGTSEISYGHFFVEIGQVVLENAYTLTSHTQTHTQTYIQSNTLTHTDQSPDFCRKTVAIMYLIISYKYFF